MARSDLWRGQRYQDAAKEIAYVTGAVADYFGTAAKRRDFRVTWEGLEDQHSPQGATNLLQKVVAFSPKLLKGQAFPLAGETVDHLLGVAAHEAGHVLLESARGSNEKYSIQRLRRVEYGNLALNVIEDIMIDGGRYRGYNTGLAMLAESTRAKTREADERRIRQAVAGEKLDATAIATIFCVAAIQGIAIPKSGDATTDEAFAALKPIGDFWSGKGGGFNSPNPRKKAVADAYMVAAILQRYAIPQQQEASEQREREQQEHGLPSPSEEKQTAEEQQETALPSEQEERSGEQEEEEEREAEEEEHSPIGGSEANGELQLCPNESPKRPSNESPRDTLERESDLDSEVWRDVSGYLKEVELKRESGGKIPDDLIRQDIVASLRREYERLANEPSRSRRLESGKIDRKRLPFWGSNRGDLFAQLAEKRLAGTMVILLDLSGSTSGFNDLIRSIGASSYAALRGTEVKPWVIAYGGFGVVTMAAPNEVGGFNVRSNGGTPTARALKKIREKIQPEGRSIIIHATDGASDDPAGVIDLEETLLADGWNMINVMIPFYRNATGAKVVDAAGVVGITINRYEELPRIIREGIGSILGE